jgi:phenylacetate-coenzyme A ligase PaaK-like adenylate-forming protein
MPELTVSLQQIFNISTPEEFNEVAVGLFHYQHQHNPVYRSFAERIVPDVGKVKHHLDIPFLPISLFKTHAITTGEFEAEAVFTSSGTTGTERSRHFVKDTGIYRQSFLKAFGHFLGDPGKYVILALLPSYLEQEGSSLVFMVRELIQATRQPASGFYLNDYAKLAAMLEQLKREKRKVILFGVTYALLDLAEQYPLNFPEMVVIETGGMKGRRKELVREALHGILKNAFGIKQVYSEYGMTELLSQAYATGEGFFKTPPWMKVLIRDPNDPLCLLPSERTGGINVIDLANVYSCGFIATLDLGRVFPDGSFEVLGRFDHSDVRGCNLLID